METLTSHPHGDTWTWVLQWASSVPFFTFIAQSLSNLCDSLPLLGKLSIFSYFVYRTVLHCELQITIQTLKLPVTFLAFSWHCLVLYLSLPATQQFHHAQHPGCALQHVPSISSTVHRSSSHRGTPSPLRNWKLFLPFLRLHYEGWFWKARWRKHPQNSMKRGKDK